MGLKLDSNGNLRGCPVGVPSNATLTDTNAIVTTTTVTAVNTNAIVSSIDLTVTTPTFPSQDLCSARTSRRNLPCTQTSSWSASMMISFSANRIALSNENTWPILTSFLRTRIRGSFIARMISTVLSFEQSSTTMSSSWLVSSGKIESICSRTWAAAR